MPHSSLFLVSTLYAQTCDLIVNTKGDSIACKIDSLADEEIHFTMKINGNWQSTKIGRSQVIEYQYDAIDKTGLFSVRKQVLFIE